VKLVKPNLISNIIKFYLLTHLISFY